MIVLSIHVPVDDKIVGVKDSFYEELEYIFHRFPK
jgi:hypothetical protein